MKKRELTKLLRGARVSVDGKGRVKINGQVVTTEVDWGDCCGYAEATITPFQDGIVTKVEVEDIDESYCEHYLLTVFHEDTKLAEFETEASSGSGWSYGAVSKILLGEETLLVSDW